MRIRLSKTFTKSVDRLSGKQLKSVLDVISEIKAAPGIDAIANCTRMVGYKNIYRIRIGSLRAFLTFHVEIVDGVVCFLFLVPRGQAYTKKVETELKRYD